MPDEGDLAYVQRELDGAFVRAAVDVITERADAVQRRLDSLPPLFDQMRELAAIGWTRLPADRQMQYEDPCGPWGAVEVEMRELDVPPGARWVIGGPQFRWIATGERHVLTLYDPAPITAIYAREPEPTVVMPTYRVYWRQAFGIGPVHTTRWQIELWVEGRLRVDDDGRLRRL